MRRNRHRGIRRHHPVSRYEIPEQEFAAGKQPAVAFLQFLPRAALRRGGESSAPPPVYELGELMVDPGRHLVQVNGESVALTLKEFQLLCLLLEHRDTVFTRDQLLNTIWGYDFDGASRTVDVHIRTLRQKLGTAGSYIQTIRGIGYKIGGAS